jgi:predicted nucleotidyltransferase
MRKSKPIDALFPRTRQAILAAFLIDPERWWYLSDLAGHLGVGPSSLQRELKALVAAEVLERRRDGNRVYFRADIRCPFFPELRGLLIKTRALVDVLRQTLEPSARRIKVAFVYGSMARAEETSTSDVDLMIIGDVGLADIAGELLEAEKRLNRPVNPTVYSPREFSERMRNRHHFLTTVVSGEKLFILGDDDDLADPSGARTSQTSPDKPTGT